VQAQYAVGGTWRLANVLRVQPSYLTLQFLGWSDLVDVPFGRIRKHVKPAVDKLELDIPPGFFSFVSRGAAVAAPSSPSRKVGVRKVVVMPPSSPTRKPALRQILTPKSSPRKVVSNRTNKSDNLINLERLKQAAVLEENFLLANELKQQVEKLNYLEIKKADAVRNEDFLAAMDIKKQISQLINGSSSLSTSDSETKQAFDDRSSETCDKSCDRFSLFAKSVDYKMVY